MTEKLTTFELGLLEHVERLNALKIGAELTFTAHAIVEKELVQRVADGTFWLTDAGMAALKREQAHG